MVQWAQEKQLLQGLLQDFTGLKLSKVQVLVWLTNFKGKNNIIHCDFYRCSLNEEFLETEITPLLGDEFLLLIEWCSPQILDAEADHYCFEINALKDGSRSITFSEISSE